jgi:hypothetical protein
MSGGPLSPWRGPEGPLARLRASRHGLAIIAVVTILLLGVVGILATLNDRDAPDPEPREAPAGPDAASIPTIAVGPRCEMLAGCPR